MTKKKICIDAGHYGKYNRSPVDPKYYESDMVWKLHLMQKEILEGYGFEVVLTRNKQTADRALYDRGYAAEGCVLFMSDHSNACKTESVDYPVVYRGYDNIGNCDELARKLAEVIAATMGTKQAGRTATRRGSSGREYYAVLRGARAAGLSDYYILEHSFHTNRKATEWLLDESNLRKLAEAECRVIAEHYGMAVGRTDGASQAGNGSQGIEEKQDGGEKQPAAFIPYLVTTTCDVLKIRSGAGTNHPIIGYISETEGKKMCYTIIEERNGWGRLKSRAGWISLSHVKREGTQAVFTPYLVETICDVLNIRSGAGMNHSVTGHISERSGRKNRYTIVEEKNGWGRLKSGAGWISLSKTRRIS